MKGLLLIDKPSGMTSYGVVARVKRILGEKRVGHTGTLDPMATGVLPIFVGRATVLSSYLLESDKTYIAVFRFGTKTDTGDITGKVISSSPNLPDAESVCSAFAKFTGNINQVPPMFSAIKKDGVPMYKLARQGGTADLPARNVTVNYIKPLSDFCGGEITVEVSCSKGTYIRSLCMDIGDYLGCGATLSALRRIKTGAFSIENCLPLENLTAENAAEHILNAENAVMHLKSVNISDNQAVRFKNGGCLDICRLKTDNLTDGQQLRVKCGDTFLGIGQTDLSDGSVKVKCLLEIPCGRDENG